MKKTRDIQLNKAHLVTQYQAQVGNQKKHDVLDDYNN
jgi:hypothetical protein